MLRSPRIEEAFYCFFMKHKYELEGNFQHFGADTFDHGIMKYVLVRTGMKEGALMQVFEDWNQKVKKTFNETSTEVVLTVTEAGKMIGLSKDHMKLFVEKNKMTKVPISRSVHRYLLLKSEMDQYIRANKLVK